jgi:hypothetical protein
MCLKGPQGGLASQMRNYILIYQQTDQFNYLHYAGGPDDPTWIEADESNETVKIYFPLDKARLLLVLNDLAHNTLFWGGVNGLQGIRTAMNLDMLHRSPRRLPNLWPSSDGLHIDSPGAGVSHHTQPGIVLPPSGDPVLQSMQISLATVTGLLLGATGNLRIEYTSIQSCLKNVISRYTSRAIDAPTASKLANQCLQI